MWTHKIQTILHLFTYIIKLCPSSWILSQQLIPLQKCWTYISFMSLSRLCPVIITHTYVMCLCLYLYIPILNECLFLQNKLVFLSISARLSFHINISELCKKPVLNSERCLPLWNKSYCHTTHIHYILFLITAF